MSTLGAIAGTFATIFSFEKSRNWTIRHGLTGNPRAGSGASIARGLKESRGLRMDTILMISRHVTSLAPARSHAAAGPFLPARPVQGTARRARASRVRPGRRPEKEIPKQR